MKFKFIPVNSPGFLTNPNRDFWFRGTTLTRSCSLIDFKKKSFKFIFILINLIKQTFFICETTGAVVVTVDALGILYAA